VAQDTDQFFGGQGNFFDFDQFEEGGSFEANPPFVEATMDRMADRIEWILETHSNVPLSFVVIVPAWTNCHAIDLMTDSRFHRPRPGSQVVLPRKQHDYRPGMQHRTEFAQQTSYIDTLLFFLQNDLGAAKWPVNDKIGLELKEKLYETRANRGGNKRHRDS
jgi:hypothetical protein